MPFLSELPDAMRRDVIAALPLRENRTRAFTSHELFDLVLTWNGIIRFTSNIISWYRHSHRSVWAIVDEDNDIIALFYEFEPARRFADEVNASVTSMEISP